MQKQHSLPYRSLLFFSAALILNACTPASPPVESNATGTESHLQESEETDAHSAEMVQAEFDAFTERIFREILSEDALSLHFTLEHPEQYGLTQPAMTFPVISAEELRKDSKDNAALLQELQVFPSSLLTEDQLFTYQMLEDALETELQSSGLELFYQPFRPTIGTQAQLPVLLAEYRFSEPADVDRYLELLSQIDTYYEQLLSYEKDRVAAGLGLSDATLDRVLQSCRDYLIRPEHSFLTETFSSRLEELPSLSEAEKNDYQQRHLTILKEDFIPAYTKLTEELEQFKGHGSKNGGLCSYEHGKEYYSYLVASETGTDSSVEELQQRIEKRLGSDMAEITRLLQNNPELQNQIHASAIALTDPTEILDHLKLQITADFPELKHADYQVKHVPEALESALSPAFFLIPPLDSEQVNTIYLNDKAGRQQTLYTMLAHEGYPGHLYQSVYFNRKNQCPLRRLLTCDGYNEGWGLYSELYSYSFDNGLSEEVQKLLTHSEATIYGLYALLDIQIHSNGWTPEQTHSFLTDFYGISDPEVTAEMYQSILENPCNYLKYYTGYLELCTMRDAAMETLGSRYSPKGFHQFILDMDGASFRVIKPYFQSWLASFDTPE